MPITIGRSCQLSAINNRYCIPAVHRISAPVCERLPRASIVLRAILNIKANIKCATENDSWSNWQWLWISLNKIGSCENQRTAMLAMAPSTIHCFATITLALIIYKPVHESSRMAARTTRAMDPWNKRDAIVRGEWPGTRWERFWGPSSLKHEHLDEFS